MLGSGELARQVQALCLLPNRRAARPKEITCSLQYFPSYSRTRSAIIGSEVVAEALYETESEPLVGLLAATARGNRDAFSQLYRETSPKFFAIALNMVRRRDLAEEILQEAYLAIWRRASLYSPARGGPSAWMASIVRYRAIDRLRAQKRTASEVSAPEGDVDAVADRSVLDIPVDFSDAISLQGCLSGLAEKQRNAILLVYYYGLTHEELAERLKAPLGTVKTWVRRGLLQLKDCMAQ